MKGISVGLQCHLQVCLQSARVVSGSNHIRLLVWKLQRTLLQQPENNIRHLKLNNADQILCALSTLVTFTCLAMLTLLGEQVETLTQTRVALPGYG